MDTQTIAGEIQEGLSRVSVVYSDGVLEATKVNLCGDPETFTFIATKNINDFIEAAKTALYPK